ncbi:hypothetical protein ACJX0J_025100, partial [Zea mays]
FQVICFPKLFCDIIFLQNIKIFSFKENVLHTKMGKDLGQEQVHQIMYNIFMISKLV